MALTVPRSLLCALVALALAPGVARADGELPAIPVPAADTLMTTAHTLAVARWGTDPCAGQVSVSWSHMGAGINARSQWMSTDVHDPATYTDCAISYNLDVDWDWPKLCTVVEHELGHLSGHDHVNDPHDVMSPYYVFPSGECSAGQQLTTAVPAPAPATPSSPASSRKAATRKAAKRKPAKRKTAKARAKTRSVKKRANRGTGRVRVAGAADSSAHAGLFGCVLASA
jgi:hypothetical protein